ncbi:MAG: DUF4190 domain-containing protein [Actinomycetota bacterium]|nr:DUF4190 domain-containing protein [Actinomycetota bacterium]
MATAALVLGILSIVLGITVIGGVLLGLLAIIFGVIGSGRAKRGLVDGRGRAVAGIITGVVGILIVVALVVAGVSFFNSSSVKNLQNCLSQAGNDQAQIQSCNNQFQNQYGK